MKTPQRAYIVVEVSNGVWQDSNLFMHPKDVVSYILECEKENPDFPQPRKSVPDPEFYLFNTIHHYQINLGSKPEGDDAVFYYIRRIALDQFNQDGSAKNEGYVDDDYIANDPQQPYRIVCTFWQGNFQEAIPAENITELAHLISKIGATWTFYGSKLNMPPLYSTEDKTPQDYIDRFMKHVSNYPNVNTLIINTPERAISSGYWKPESDFSEDTEDSLLALGMTIVREAQNDPDNSDLVADMCAWRDRVGQLFKRRGQSEPGIIVVRKGCVETKPEGTEVLDIDALACGEIELSDLSAPALRYLKAEHTRLFERLMKAGGQ